MRVGFSLAGVYSNPANGAAQRTAGQLQIENRAVPCKVLTDNGYIHRRRAVTIRWRVEGLRNVQSGFRDPHQAPGTARAPRQRTLLPRLAAGSRAADVAQ